MSIASRQRNPKRPTHWSRPLFPGPDKGYIDARQFGMMRAPSDSTCESHNYKPHGKFCGVIKAIKNFRAEVRAKARESKFDLKST